MKYIANIHHAIFIGDGHSKFFICKDSIYVYIYIVVIRYNICIILLTL